MAAASADFETQDRHLSLRLARGFSALAALTYGLIVLGALVRSHGAGLACPDWPLCFGEVIPEFDFKVAFEWGHRAVAGSVALIFAGLAAATLRRPPLRRAMGAGLALAAALLAVQIVLGGLTVLELLATWTVTSHLVTGNAFALAVVLLARRLAALADPAARALGDTRPVERLVISLAGLLLAVQIVLGGLVSSSYAGLACPDWPTCMNGEFFPTWRGVQGLHLFHRMLGYTLAAVVLAAAWAGRRHASAAPWIRAAGALALAQVVVGIANVVMRLPVEVTGLHSALAAALICTVGVSVREVWRSAPAGERAS